MKIVSIREMQKADRAAIDIYGIPAIVLMENAGRAVAAETAKMFLRILKGTSLAESPAGFPEKSIAVVAGGGNNGGDGFVAARYLFEQGISTTVFISKKAKDYAADAAVNLNIITKLGIPVLDAEEQLNMNAAFLSEYLLLVDALLGTGFKPPVSGLPENLIKSMLCSGRPVVSIDIPSGLDGDSGKPMNTAVKASLTVTLGLAKKGFFEKEGRAHTGDLIVADIGIPRAVTKAL